MNTPARSVLITGAGMVGAYTARLLLDAGDRVTLLDREISRDYLERVLGDREYETIEVDLTDVTATDAALAGRSIDAVVHTAALVAARAQRDVLETLDVNVAVPLRLMTWAAGAGVRRFVVLSSWSVYDEEQSGPIDENAALAKRFVSYYTAGKLAMEHLLSAQAKATGVEVVAIRPTVIYGYGPNLGGGVGSAVLEGQVLRALAGEPVALPRSIISQTELVYVEDAAAFVAAAVSVPLEHAYEWITVGSQETTTIEQLADTLREVFPGVPVSIEDGAGSSVIPPRQEHPTAVAATIDRLGVQVPLTRRAGFEKFAAVLREHEGRGVQA